MDSNITSTRHRKSSLGRSSLIERSIKLLETFFSTDFEWEEFSTMVINYELPGEFRSILWKVYLGILPSPFSKKEWILKTKADRKEFENIISEQNFENTLNYYNDRLNGQEKNIENISLMKFNFDFEYDFGFIKEEINKYSNDYDIFKSEILKKSFLSIYLAWRVQNNMILNNNSIVFISRILAILIYSLYSSIMHLNNNNNLIQEIDDNEENLKNIFYYLNFEDYYDHDIFKIFESILKISEFKNYIINYSDGKLENKLNQEISQINNSEENNLIEIFEKKLNLESEEHCFSNNFIENVSFNFLFLINKDLLKKLYSKEFNLYNFTACYYLSFLFNATKFENISYFVDIVLMHSKKEDLRFLGYLIISILVNLENEYIDLSKEDITNFFSNFPLMKKDPKDFVGKALKIRKKINKKFYNN